MTASTTGTQRLHHERERRNRGASDRVRRVVLAVRQPGDVWTAPSAWGIVAPGGDPSNAEITGDGRRPALDREHLDVDALSVLGRTIPPSRRVHERLPERHAPTQHRLPHPDRRHVDGDAARRRRRRADPGGEPAAYQYPGRDEAAPVPDAPTTSATPTRAAAGSTSTGPWPWRSATRPPRSYQSNLPLARFDRRSTRGRSWPKPNLRGMTKKATRPRLPCPRGRSLGQGQGPCPSRARRGSRVEPRARYVRKGPRRVRPPLRSRPLAEPAPGR